MPTWKLYDFQDKRLGKTARLLGAAPQRDRSTTRKTTTRPHSEFSTGNDAHRRSGIMISPTVTVRRLAGAGLT
jgi:hypothetical protein